MTGVEGIQESTNKTKAIVIHIAELITDILKAHVMLKLKLSNIYIHFSLGYWFNGSISAKFEQTKVPLLSSTF